MYVLYKNQHITLILFFSVLVLTSFDDRAAGCRLCVMFSPSNHGLYVIVLLPSAQLELKTHPETSEASGFDALTECGVSSVGSGLKE
jgi:hypothetical protein